MQKFTGIIYGNRSAKIFQLKSETAIIVNKNVHKLDEINILQDKL